MHVSPLRFQISPVFMPIKVNMQKPSRSIAGALKLLPESGSRIKLRLLDLLNALSTVYRAEGRYLEAARSLSQAIAIEEKVSSTDPSSLADSYSTLAELYKARRQYVAGAEAAEQH